MEENLEFPVEVVLLGDLKPHPQNYQEHPDDQLEHIIESIKENGLYRNVVIARDDTILAGHGVVKALSKMGRDTVSVIRLDLAPDSPRALKVLTGDNEISHLATRDDRALTELLKIVKDEDESGLLGTGYDEMMLANLIFVTRATSEIEDFDEAAHWVGMPEYEEEAQSYQISVHFRSEEDKNTFIEQSGVGMMTHKVAWWPPKERKDLSSVLYDD